MNKIYLLLIFSFFIIFSGIINIAAGAGLDWDYLSYHYYNAYAVLNNRIGFDMMPAGVQSYLNPTLDIISYLVVNSFRQYPKLILFLQGLPYGVLAFTIYLLNRTIFIKCIDKKISNYIFIFVSTVLCISESMLVSEIGMSFNDIPISTLFVVALILLIKSIREYKFRYVGWAGFLIGLACGLKFTFACFAIAILVSYMFFVPRKNIYDVLKRVGLLLLFMFIGFTLIDGWWVLILWKHFKNPMFPFYNGIFKSDLYTAVNYHDVRFFKIAYIKRLFLPLYWFDNSSWLVQEASFFDLRHIFAYVATILTPFLIFANLRMSFLKNGEVKISSDKKIYLFLSFYFIFSFLIWAKMFCVLRYLLPILVLNGTMIVIAFVQFPEWLKKREVYSTLFFILLIINLGYSPINWGRSKKIISAPDLKIPDNSIVYMGGAPSSYLIPQQNKTARYVFLIGDGASGSSEFTQSKAYFELADKYEKQATKKYLIRYRNINIYPDAVKINSKYIIEKYYKKTKNCKNIESIHIFVDTYYQIPKFKICEIE